VNWLLLRGLTREQAHWGEFPEVFLQTVKSSRVHFLDLPGVGTEIHRTAPATIQETVSDLRERWLSLKTNAEGGGEWGVLSLSLGAMIAMDWVYCYPEDFKKIVVMNTSAANLNPAWERLNFKILPKLLKIAKTKDFALKEKKILEITTHMQRNIDLRAREWGEIARLRPVSIKTAVHQIRAAIGFRLKTPIRIPLLMLSSLNDIMTHVKCPFNIARELNSQLITHSFAGHDIPLDDPKWVAEQVQLWVSTQ